MPERGGERNPETASPESDASEPETSFQTAPLPAISAADLADHLRLLLPEVSAQWTEAMHAGHVRLVQQHATSSWMALRALVNTWAERLPPAGDGTPRKTKWSYPLPINDLVGWPPEPQSGVEELDRIEVAIFYALEATAEAFNALAEEIPSERPPPGPPLGDFWSAGGFAVVAGRLQGLAELLRAHDAARLALEPPAPRLVPPTLRDRDLERARRLIVIGDYEAALPYLLRVAYGAVAAGGGLLLEELRKPLYPALAASLPGSYLTLVVGALEPAVARIGVGLSVAPATAIALAVEALPVIEWAASAPPPGLDGALLRVDVPNG